MWVYELWMWLTRGMRGQQLQFELTRTWVLGLTSLFGAYYHSNSCLELINSTSLIDTTLRIDVGDHTCVLHAEYEMARIRIPRDRVTESKIAHDPPSVISRAGEGCTPG